MWSFNPFLSRIAAIDESSSISYETLELEGDVLSGNLAARSLVFCLCRNDIGALVGYTGFTRNKIVPLLLDEGIDRQLLQALIKLYKPVYFWMPQNEQAQRFGQAIYCQRGYVLIKSDISPPAKQPQLHEDLALLLTTSGSTGSPKLVRLSEHNLLANAQSIVEYLELDKNERPITTLPIYYSYGLSVINSHLLVGATIIMTTKGFMQREFWEHYKAHKATSLAGVPYNYDMLKKLRFFMMDLPTLRVMTQAGGRLSPDLHHEYAEFAQRTGRRFYVMYGQTEATARMSYLPYAHSLDKCGSIGIAIPGGEFSLVDENGLEIGTADTVGELLYRGTNVSLGYAECAADLLKGDERHGELATGDFAKRDAQGYYYLVGRKSRFLKIFGNRVNLDEMEQLLSQKFALELACAGADDHLQIFVTDGSLASELLHFASTTSGLHPSAFEVRVITKIPRSESGKVLYKELLNVGT